MSNNNKTILIFIETDIEAIFFNVWAFLNAYDIDFVYRYNL